MIRYVPDPGERAVKFLRGIANGTRAPLDPDDLRAAERDCHQLGLIRYREHGARVELTADGRRTLVGRSTW